MQSKSQSKHSWFIVSILGIVAFAILILGLLFSLSGQLSYAKLSAASGQTLPKTTLSTRRVKSVLPVRLKIPKIKVDAFLERVGLTAQWAVGVPKGGVNAARYELGPRPGKIGNAIIVWHYGTWKTGQWSVFDHLQNLKKGDKIYVEDASGVSISFVVTKSRTYSPTAIVPEVFNSTDGKSHLNLITCDGVRNKITKHYPNRLVVFADRE